MNDTRELWMREGCKNGVTEFTTLILHGDDQHKAWLLAARDAFIAGEPMPPPSGGNSFGRGWAAAIEAAAALAEEKASQLDRLATKAFEQGRTTDRIAYTNEAAVCDMLSLRISALKPPTQEET
jgi:hypothetical protein